jgi:hypothetical protein
VFKRILTHLSGKKSSPAASSQVPSPEVTYLAHKYFGNGWHRRGDPRTILGVTLDGFRTWVLDHGIPTFVLQEGHWGGDNHMVISEQNGVWMFGFAERGTATLWSKHPTIESAREAAVISL